MDLRTRLINRPSILVVHVMDAAHQHRAHRHNHDRHPNLRLPHDHDAPAVLTKHVQRTRFINRLRVHSVVRPRYLRHALHRPADGRVPAVVVLWRQPCNDEGAAVELLREGLGAEESLEGESGAFDPVAGGEVDGGEDGHAAVGGGGGDGGVVGLGDGAGGGLDGAGEEVVEGGVLGGVGLDHFGEGGGEVEGGDEGSDVGSAGGVVVFFAHFFGFWEDM